MLLFGRHDADGPSYRIYHDVVFDVPQLGLLRPAKGSREQAVGAGSRARYCLGLGEPFLALGSNGFGACCTLLRGGGLRFARTQNALDILAHQIPEVILRRSVDCGAGGIGSGSRATAGTGCGAARDLAAHANARLGVARHIDVVDLVGAQERRVRLDDDGLAFGVVADVDLPGESIENGRQRFVDRVECHASLHSGMDVDVLLGVARQGKQQFFYRDFLHYHAVSRDFDLRLGLGHQITHRYRREDFIVRCRGRKLLGVDMPLRRRDRRLVCAADVSQSKQDQSDKGKDASRHDVTAYGNKLLGRLRCHTPRSAHFLPVTHCQLSKNYSVPVGRPSSTRTPRGTL